MINLKSTTWFSVVWAITFSALIGYGCAHQWYRDFPPFSMKAAFIWLVMACMVGLIGWYVKVNARVHGVTLWGTHTGLAFLALAKSAIVVGEIASGAWLGILVLVASKKSQLQAAEHDFPVTIVGLIGSIALIAAGLFLEWQLKLPSESNNNSNQQPPSV